MEFGFIEILYLSLPFGNFAETDLMDEEIYASRLFGCKYIINEGMKIGMIFSDIHLFIGHIIIVLVLSEIDTKLI